MRARKLRWVFRVKGGYFYYERNGNENKIEG